MEIKALSDRNSRNGHDFVSILGSGMKVVGDCSSDGAIRIDGRIEGSVKAGKSVIVGQGGCVIGDIATKDAIVGGRVQGCISADSRVELLGTCHVEGDIRSRRIKLDEGGQVDGSLFMRDMGLSLVESSDEGSSEEALDHVTAAKTVKPAPKTNKRAG
ncbi:MAG: polymer-forming cytoskeletal protein [Gemmatimonadota bacterium]